MTFVAQPYERFVDDLLTALTGGVIREEHQFIGVDRAYTLAHPSVMEPSLRVFGQRDEGFVLFERGIDYRYDATDQAIVWETEGRLPDDRSFFYVSYYLPEGKPRLTDRNPGSVNSIFSAAFAREYTVLHKQMEMVYRSAFVDLAEGSSLEHIAALLALTRKDAKFAIGEVLFKRSSPAPGDISLPAGTVISTSQGQNFETTDKRTLRRGQLSITVPIRAQVEGPAGRVEANEITTVNRPVFGIEAVQNEQPTFFATSRETDEELRRRIKGTLEKAGRATLDAIKYGLVEDVPQVTEAITQVSEDPNVPGLVEVRLGIAEGADTELVRRVEQAIFNSRPAGVRVRHNLSGQTPQTGAPQTVAAPASPEAVTRASIMADFRAIGEPLPASSVPDAAAGEDATLPLRVEVLIALTQRSLSVGDKEKIEDGVRAAIVDYIQNLPMGATLVFNKLLARIVQSDDVADASLMIRSQAAVAGGVVYKANLDTKGRKATIGTADVFIELMEQAVHIDIQVLLMPKQQREEAPSPPEMTEALRGAIRAVVERVVSAGSLVRRGDLRAAIVEVLEPSQFTLVDDNGVTLNAEYEETGRLMNNATEVSLQEHEVARLRELQVEVPGVLDGQI